MTEIDQNDCENLNNYRRRTTTVELESSLKGDTFFGCRSLGVCSFGGVQSIDVSLMVLLVVKRHDLLRDVRFESIVSVRKVRENVGHCCRCCG
jgi:hypothetical protein